MGTRTPRKHLIAISLLTLTVIKEMLQPNGSWNEDHQTERGLLLNRSWQPRV